LPDRRRQIELLIATRFDLLWFPTAPGFKATGKTKTGKRPSRFMPCERCGGYEVWRRGIRTAHVNGTGTVRDRFGRENPCEVCNGKGRVPWDEYTGEIVVTDASEPKLGELIRRDTKRVKCPDCQDLSGRATGQVHGAGCRRCEGTGLAAVPGSWLSTPRLENGSDGSDGSVDPLTASIVRRDQAGSYHDLDLALAGISHHVNKPPRYLSLTVNADQARRLLDELYLPPASKHFETLGVFEQALVELAMAYIDARMPEPIIVPRDVVANARERQQALKGNALNGLSRERRDKLIRQWDRQGKPRAWIGQQTGLSDRQLREIINGKGVTA
jgi:hypothetical protein